MKVLGVAIFCAACAVMTTGETSARLHDVERTGVVTIIGAVPPADQADTVPADTVPADTVPADTVPADTVPADTVPADTGLGSGDSLPAETLAGR
jgi:hypothetical protein